MILITGGAGYLGSIIKNYFLNKGYKCIVADILKDSDSHPNLKSIILDITNRAELEPLFKNNNITSVIHCAALLQFTKKNQKKFFETNIASTKYLAELCIKYSVKDYIYISSNCVYGKVNQLNISEREDILPFEEYGYSKAESEKILLEYNESLNISILRCPTIISEGRLGILSIVFDFIIENRKLWLVGNGENKYQFIYAKDVAVICDKLLSNAASGVRIFNIGTDKVESLNAVFKNLIKFANSKTKLYHLPGFIMLPLMKLCYKLGISPLGPYQYNMICNTYSGDISSIKNATGWSPNMSNSEIIITAYKYYVENKASLEKNNNLVGHKRLANAGIINFLKWLS